MNKLVEVACKSSGMKKMPSFELLVFLEGTNNILRGILDDVESYSYDVYYALLILTHNFRMITNPDYLKNKGEYSYFKKKISSYYRSGGNRDILTYILSFDDEQQQEIVKLIEKSKQEFVILSFYKGYQGLPEELKHFCEVPDFYPEISNDLVKSIFKK